MWEKKYEVQGILSLPLDPALTIFFTGIGGQVSQIQSRIGRVGHEHGRAVITPAATHALFKEYLSVIVSTITH